MKVKIESKIEKGNFGKIKSIIDICERAMNEEELRRSLSLQDETETVIWGFGHHHFWCSQLVSGSFGRVLFIEFK
jgi:hypothetical protein